MLTYWDKRWVLLPAVLSAPRLPVPSSPHAEHTPLQPGLGVLTDRAPDGVLAICRAGAVGGLCRGGAEGGGSRKGTLQMATVLFAEEVETSLFPSRKHVFQVVFREDDSSERILFMEVTASVPIPPLTQPPTLARPGPRRRGWGSVWPGLRLRRRRADTTRTHTYAAVAGPGHPHTAGLGNHHR